MGIWQRFIDNVTLRRFCVLLSVVLILYISRSMLSIFLLTFIFSLLVVKATNFIRRRIKIPNWIIVALIYLVLVGLLVLTITRYAPQLIQQTIKSTSNLIKFYSDPDNLPADATIRQINKIVAASGVMNQLKDGVTLVLKYLTSIGKMGITLFMSILLSFFFTIEKDSMVKFSKNFLDSDFGWYFQDLYFFGEKFVQTFGLVIEAQFFIAICNTILTTAVLIFMHLPQVAVLAIMVFILSLIPVAGVIISFFPLSLICYTVGGWQDVIYLLITILVVHIIEAYILNPNFYSSRTNLPIFYTFVVLLIGDHFFGTWGLICGVPVFMFILDILGVQIIGGKPTKKTA